MARSALTTVRSAVADDGEAHFLHDPEHSEDPEQDTAANGHGAEPERPALEGDPRASLTRSLYGGIGLLDDESN